MTRAENTLAIGERIVGAGNPAFIIAEAGSCHDGKFSQAIELIDAAAEAGADAVKFQFFTAEGLYLREDPRFEAVKPYETPRAWIPELATHARQRGIMFSASPFDPESADLLVEAGAPFLKIASPEIRDVPLMRHCAASGLPLVVSTGVCTLADVDRALHCLFEAGALDLVLLHCVSIYPASPVDLNLRAIETLHRAFGLPVGLSDHSMSTTIPAVAVALGACVIEKHFTLDRSLEGPDHQISVEVSEFAAMVNAIREVEVALGSPHKRIIEGKERPDLHEKSIVARVDIAAGEAITADKVAVKRAQKGINPFLLDEVIGRAALADISRDSLITLDDLGKRV